MSAVETGPGIDVDGTGLDPGDRRVAEGATGMLRALNATGLLEAADVLVAQRLGALAAETREPVLLAVALAVRAVRSGSTCIDLDSAGRLLPQVAASKVAARKVVAPKTADWVAALQDSPLSAAGVVHLDGTTLYLARYWDEETQLVGDLRLRDRQDPPVLDADALEAALAAYFPGATSDDQRQAARIACERWTSVVTGGPGTGKTTTVARLLGVLLALDPALRVALAAPTGKAAARLAEAIKEATDHRFFPGAGPGGGAQAAAAREAVRRLEARTLHRLLGWRADSSTRFRHDRRNRLPYDIVVVDETSMVSLTLMARLLEAMRPQARLVLVGDADQLASVEAGAVLRDVVEGWSGGPVGRLARVHRYGANIGELAAAVHAGDPDQVVAILAEGRVPGAADDGEVVWAASGDDLGARLREQALALHRAAVRGDADQALQRFEAHRLLCAHRQGPFGVAEWNQRVERLLREDLGQDWLGEWYPGRPFIVNGNDRGLQLWNGDTGVACVEPASDRTGSRLVGAMRAPGSALRLLATTRLAEVSTAHAMTVHRSQGSQFEEVTVLLPEPGSRVLTRELLYTAVTRARRVVRVVGSEESVRAAVTRRAERATGLARRLSSDRRSPAESA